MNIQNFFFDLDGTLINSEPGLYHAHTHCLEQLNHNCGLKILAEEGVGWTIGPPLSLTVPRLIGSEEPDKIRHYIETFQRLYREVYFKDFILYEGIDSLLHNLNKKNKTIFICTSKPEPIAQKLMEHLQYNTLICDLIGSHLDERPHDKSDLLRELCAKYTCLPEQSAMIGDRSYDMLAGKQLNFVVRIGVTYGFGTEAELRTNGATHIAHHAGDIENYIN